jgi:hypothetical protein
MENKQVPTTPTNFVENGNYRVATVKQVKTDKTVVECHFDNIKLALYHDAPRHHKSIEGLAVGDLCYVYRTALDACILIDFVKQ